MALRDDEVIAFLTAFRSPERPDSYFLWQTATKPRHGIAALGLELLEFAVKREVSHGARFVEASVDKDNKPIRLVMKTLCKRLGGHLTEELLYSSEFLSSKDAEHHDETLNRAGFAGGYCV
ncbi:GNAT family N-acetyltransferase [Rhizobium bangladeshense]|uniref:GNAT family N-acetyltransferase n=1 Tax=Rhizobium bangladeshense TaxID=1138189 RepID=UPI001A99FE57|nr:GNAT family N-acetyltransferase [Rhizobium bangladeshense]MBX4935279.1 hypothetical protein [Rhizobium bangladeshense]QSY91964.1 hypothetical protein J2J98_26540 [Rhizobium bangladeshense]